MATFTEAQITDLAEILATNSDALAYHLDLYESVITESDKTKILLIVTEWQGITGNPSVRFTGNDANEGFNMSIAEYRASLARKIANFVQWPMSSGSRLVRA